MYRSSRFTPWRLDNPTETGYRPSAMCTNPPIARGASPFYRVVRTEVLVENAGGMPALCRAANGDLLFAYATHWEPVPTGGLVFDGALGPSYAGLFVSDDYGQSWKADALMTSPDPQNTIPFDAPGMSSLENGNILAIPFASDRKQAGNPLMGWTEGMHYVINELALTAAAPGRR